MKPRVAIIGGGWAGCAAGLSLAEAGIAVTLFEAGGTPGGRARGLELNGLELDNGQHLLLGAYRQTIQLITAVKAEEGTQHAPLLRLPLALDQPPDFSLSCPPLPAPFHLLAGLLSARGISLLDKLAAARWMHAQLRQPLVDDISVAQLIAPQPKKIRAALWEPLCIAALNTPTAHASAKIYMQVLRAVFAHAREDSDLLFPRLDLTSLFPEPAATRMIALGSQVRLHTRVLSMRHQAQQFTLCTQRDSYTFDRVIVAVAPQHLAKLGHTIAELQDVIAAVETYCYEAIATLYVQYPSEVRLARPMLALLGGPAQFVFDRGQTHGQWGLLALVVSAASDLIGQSQDWWIEKARQQLSRIQALPNPIWQKAIVEKQATYSCGPNLTRPDNHTPHPDIFLAGDYTAGPYPATLESATLSGVKSAHLVMNSL